jgi:hypothetical protein
MPQFYRAVSSDCSSMRMGDFSERQLSRNWAGLRRDQEWQPYVDTNHF